MKLHTRLPIIGLSLLFCLMLATKSNIYGFGDIYSIEGSDMVDVPNPNVLVVIDPGHGGYDKGCSGAHKHEKDVNLKIAKKLETILKNSCAQIDIILTRESDDFISLEKRIQIANQNKADLFISIHCNSLEQGHATGSETHVAGLSFVNADQKEYLRRHNYIDQDALQEIKKHQLSKPEKMLVLKNSLDLAAIVHESLEKGLPYKSRGVKESGFTVLKYLKMAGVLVEVGFLSNKKQEAFMSSNDGGEKIAASLFEAIDLYIKENDLINQKQKAYDRFFNQFDSQKEFSLETFSIELIQTKDTPLLYFEPRWDELESIYVVKEGDFYHYRTGYFTNYTAAQNALPNLKALGFYHVKIVEVPPKN